MKKILILCCLWLFSSNLSAQEAGNIFGVVEGFWLPDEVCELHPGWERIIFDWSQHQPEGSDDWYTLNVDDRWLAAAQDCDREVVAIFKHTPAWATDGTAGPGVPRGLYLPVDDPGNLWARFVRKSAEYYAPRGVSRFIIWNEPDITRETYGFEFEGTLDDYYQMLKVAYLALKQGNSDAEILLAGMTYWHDLNAGRRLYLDRLLERITSDPEAVANNYYFDIASLHIYFRSETVYDIVRQTRELLNQYGLTDKRIWITEMNAGPTDDPLWPVVRPQYQIDLDQQAAYLVQAAALGVAAGAERMAVYKFYDWNLPPGGEAFGLLRADSSRRPAFDAWGMIIREFNNVESALHAQTERAEVVFLRRSDGQQLIVAWSRTAEPTQIRIADNGEIATLFDLYGRPIGIESAEGVYTLTLEGARCNTVDGCAVGGKVQIFTQPVGEILIQEITSSGMVDLVFE
ncbi:MAG: LIM domain-binding protein [Anaerolineae bacterium]|nr:LIM domain-binding protein [Anaerolineae bacterium]